jgi:hypothetical protein
MDMFRHPETGQYLPTPNIPMTFNVDKTQHQLQFNNQLDNTNQPSAVPFNFRGGMCNGITSIAGQKPFNNTEFSNAMSNLKKENEKKEKEKEKSATIDNMFTELSQMRAQIQNLSNAIDNMFTILSKLK